MTDRRDLAKVGDLIDVVLGKVAKSGVAPIVRLRQRWPEIAGEWAERSVPVAIAHGVLTLEVASGLDASMLKYATSQLLAAASLELGDAIPLRRVAVRVRTRGSGPK